MTQRREQQRGAIHHDGRAPAAHVGLPAELQLLVGAVIGHQVQQQGSRRIPPAVQRSTAGSTALGFEVPVPVGAVPQLKHLLRQACATDGQWAAGESRARSGVKDQLARHMLQTAQSWWMPVSEALPPWIPSSTLHFEMHQVHLPFGHLLTAFGPAALHFSVPL